MEENNKQQIIISVDVETLGTVPGIHPMIAIGAVALDWDEKELSRFSANMEILDDLEICDETLEWWLDPSRNEAWLKTRSKAAAPEFVMPCFRAWVDLLMEHYDVSFLAKPSGFDMGFIQYYLQRFAKGNLLPKSRCYDLYTMISDLTGVPMSSVSVDDVKEISEDLTKGTQHTALDDALFQGKLACRVNAELKANMVLASKVRCAINEEVEADLGVKVYEEGLGCNKSEPQQLVETQTCTRTPYHDGPCNGMPCETVAKYLTAEPGLGKDGSQFISAETSQTKPVARPEPPQEIINLIKEMFGSDVHFVNWQDLPAFAQERRR